MDCNKEEAIRAKSIAEKKMQSKDFVGARKIAIKAQQLYSDLENISQMLMVCDVHCSAEKLFGTEMDWYGILQIDQTADEITIKKQYRKFALQLHPDKNKFSGAEAAFKLIGEAQRVLLDRDKRSMHDLKRKTSVSKTGVPHQPPQRASWNSNPGVQNNSRGNFSGVNLQSQQQQQPFPPGYSDARSTFWTACPFCSVKYQYYREVLLRSLRCQGCGKPFIAYDTNVPGGAPPPPPPTNLSQQAFPPKKVNVNMSEVTFQRNVGAENSKAKPFQKTEKKASSSSGVRPEKVKRKRERKRVVESSESSVSESSSDSEEDMVINDAVLQAGLKSGIYGEQQPRRSSRHKQNVSYKEHLSDGEDTPLSKREKRSGSSCATEEEDEDALKEEESNMNNKSDCAADATGDEEKVKQKKSAYFEECLPKGVGEKKFGAKERVKVFDSKKRSLENSPLDKSSNEKQEPDPLYSFPDSDFNDFERYRKEELFEAGQVWAIYDTRNGMPRFYARIKKVHSPEFKLQITWLEPDPDDDNEKKWAKADLPFSCGKFRQGHSETTKDLPMFSHLMIWGKIRSAYMIYPRRGETWAIFKNWDIKWFSDPDSNQKHFEYEFVDILSDYSKDVGIFVALLEKVKSFVSVFRRVKDGKGTFQVPSGELLRFSHRVPSYTLTGDEGVGVPLGSVELDPAALPFNIEEVPVSRERKTEASTRTNGFSASPDTRNEDGNVPKGSSPEGIEGIDIPEAEFYNFDADKSLEKFEIGQIWALYSDEDGLPKYYGQIKSIDSHRSKLYIAWLANLLPDNVIRWHDEEMPVSCGRFRVRRGPLQDYDSTLSFSHRLNAVSIGKNDFEIYPHRGEVWALYKNWTAHLSCSDLDTCEYDIVVVQTENDLQREVLILERVDGFNSVFKTRAKGGSAETMTVRGVELLRFSHMIPSFQLTDEKGGSLRGCWELDPAALPLRFFSQT
ncbi:hypothetical protein ACFX2I_021878 [Malus domestica]